MYQNVRFPHLHIKLFNRWALTEILIMESGAPLLLMATQIQALEKHQLLFLKIVGASFGWQ